MKTYKPILYMLVVMSLISLCSMFLHIKVGHGNQSFPFNGAEVSSGLEPVDVSEQAEVGAPKVLLSPPSASLLEKEFGDEYMTIVWAAIDNWCVGDDFLILLAIRKQENGGPGNEFGIKCSKHINTNLHDQAACASVTIMKNRARWKEADEELFGYKGFIFFLGTRYCPDDTVNWVRNVTYWFEKLKVMRDETETEKPNP